MRNITERSFFARDTRRRGCNDEKRVINVPFFGYVEHVLGARVRAFTRGYGARCKNDQERRPSFIYVYTQRTVWGRRRTINDPSGRNACLLARDITCLPLCPVDPVRDFDRIWSGNINWLPISIFQLVTHSRPERKFLGETQETVWTCISIFVKHCRYY